jgi:hypothetical protein
MTTIGSYTVQGYCTTTGVYESTVWTLRDAYTEIRDHADDWMWWEIVQNGEVLASGGDMR